MKIPTLSVSARITAGYIIAGGLALAILVSSLQQIGNIDRALDSITDTAMPSSEASAQILSNQLHSQVRLTELLNTSDRELIKKYKKDYEQYQLTAKLSIGNLEKTNIENKEIAKQISLLSEQIETINQSGLRAQDLYLNYLKKKAIIQEQSLEFSDMADEILSYAIDVESIATGGTKGGIEEVINLLDEVQANTLAAIETDFMPSLLSSEQDVSTQLSDIESILSKIDTNKNISNERSYIALKDSYKRLKEASTGEKGIFSSQKEGINSKKSANKEFDSFNKSSDEFSEKLEGLFKQIQAYGSNISSTTKSTVTSSVQFLLAFSALAIAILCLIAWSVIRSIRKPLIEILMAIKVMSKGNLNQNFDCNRSDEIGDLASSMTELSETLRSMIEGIGDNASKLHDTAENTAKTAQQAGESIYRQKDQTDLIATAVHQMSSTVEEISRSAQLTLEQVENVHSEANEGNHLLQKNIASMRNLATEINTGSEIISELNEDTERVGSILDVIRGVAEQTNLLALNAAIEAARAGEQGRGFAVVADEVRTLASRSHDSTEEIQEMILRLQERANAAVTTMEKSRSDAQLSVDEVSKTGIALENITRSIDKIRDMSHHIASAAEQQACTTQEQSHNISNIANAADETAKGAKENQQASERLTDMADSLKGMVGRFQL